MFNPQAFASGFKAACARYNISSEMLLKLAERQEEDEHSGPHPFHTAQQAANVALGAPIESATPSLGEIITRLNSLGTYGAPGKPRLPFGN